MSARLHKTGIVCVALFAALAASSSAVTVTNLYHTNRVFRPIPTTITGPLTAYRVWTTASNLTEVLGPTNITVHTNANTFAREYEAVAWGYESANAAWTSVVATYSSHYQTYPTSTYDNVGWIKGTREAYGTWGGYLWLMQNQVDFKSSETNLWVSPNGVTSYIVRVCVGSIGDYLPMANAVTVGPTNWAVITNYPGSGTATEAVYRADYRAYYEIILMQKLPLGRQVKLSKHVIGKVYVPSKWGGSNTLWAGGNNIELFYDGGSNLTWQTAAKIYNGQYASNRVAQGSPCVYDVPDDHYGWYYIRVTNVESAVVSNEFVETGVASNRPWNGWYWPTKPDVNPNLYDDGYALNKYDQVYGTNSHAQACEATGHVGSASWEGHCWGWSVASILQPQPQATTANGVNFNQDDMEGLYTELADTEDAYPDPYLSVDGIPPGPPSGAHGEAVDAYCGSFHDKLRDNLRRDHYPIQSNLRDGSSPLHSDEVWNHAIWKYISKMREASGAISNQYVVEITTTIFANSDGNPPPSTGTGDRAETYKYTVGFSLGEIDANYPGQNWISADHYVPENLWRLNTSSWQSRNPYVTKSNVDGL